MTVRQVFYQAMVAQLVEKSEKGYRKVQYAVLQLRRAGDVAYEAIVDSTRRLIQAYTSTSVAERLREAARFYRKALWDKSDCQLEIWLEKDALAGVVEPVTDRYDVALVVARGFSSETAVWEAAQRLLENGKPAHVFHLGDYDPSGQAAAADIERKLRDFAPGLEITFERLAVTPEQIAAWSLPTRPTKASDTRAGFTSAISVELDAIDPRRLRALVQEAIERHLPPERFVELMSEERAEREQAMEVIDEALSYANDDEED